MAIIINEEDSERRKRLARFYARRERYEKAFRAMGMMPIYYEVTEMEKKLAIRFDRKKFFDEVRNPKKCIIIENI